MSGPANVAPSPVAWRVPGGTRPTVRRVTSGILGQLLAGRTILAGEPGQPCVLAGGDLGPDATAATLIWGGGLGSSTGSVPALEPRHVLAVRGRLTADRMVAAGIRLRDIPFGDPGLLANVLLDPTDRTDTAPIAVVPSSTGRQHPFFANLRSSREARVVNLDRDDLVPLREIARAEVVVAQDLHGLIYAEAFARPAVWVADRSDAGHDFRFKDWFTTVWERQDRPLMLGGAVDQLAVLARRMTSTQASASLAEALRGV